MLPRGFALVVAMCVSLAASADGAERKALLCPDGALGAFGASSEDMAVRLMTSGRSHVEAGDLCAAERAFYAASTWPKTFGAALTELGRLYERAGRPDDAANAYAQALKADIGNRPARDRLLALRRSQAEARAAKSMADAEALEKAGRISDAVNRYRDVLRFDPNHKIAVTRMADLLVRMNDLERAEKAYLRAISIDPDYEPAYSGLTKLRERVVNEALQRDRDRARNAAPAEKVAVYRRILQHYPNDREAWVKLAQTLMSLHRFDEAEETLHGMLGRNRFDATAEAMLDTLKKMRAEADAGTAKTMVASTPGAASAQSETALRAAVAAHPDSADPKLALAKHLLAAGQPAEAAKEFQDALAVQPSSQEAYQGLGFALTAQGRYAEAEAAQRNAIRLNPFAAKAHHGLALALAMQGKVQSAELAFRDSIRLDPEDPRALANLGLALELQMRLSEAEAAYQMAADLAPGYEMARVNLARLKKRQQGPTPTGFDLLVPTGRTGDDVGTSTVAKKSLPVSDELRSAARQSMTWRRLVAKERALRASFEQANLELDVLTQMRQDGKGDAKSLDKSIAEKKEELAAFSEMLIQVRKNRESFVGDYMSKSPPATN